MTPELVRLQQNLRETLRKLSQRQLYTIARAMGDELTRRELDASLEARALECALLAQAAREQRAIFSADCSHPVDEGCADCGRIPSDVGLPMPAAGKS